MTRIRDLRRDIVTAAAGVMPAGRCFRSLEQVIGPPCVAVSDVKVTAGANRPLEMTATVLAFPDGAADPTVRTDRLDDLADGLALALIAAGFRLDSIVSAAEFNDAGTPSVHGWQLEITRIYPPYIPEP